MKSQMVGLQAEYDRLMKEAVDPNPELAVKKKRGRPAKTIGDIMEVKLVSYSKSLPNTKQRVLMMYRN